MFCNADATADFEDFVFEDCEITNIQKNFYYNNVATYTIKNIYAKEFTFPIKYYSRWYSNIQYLQNNTLRRNANVYFFENNIVYNKTSVAGQILSWDNKIVQTPRPATNKSILL